MGSGHEVKTEKEKFTRADLGHYFDLKHHFVEQSLFDNNLVGNPDAASVHGFDPIQNVTVSHVVQNGETYVKTVTNQSTNTPGTWPIGGIIPVTPGAQYVLKVKGYRSAVNNVYLFARNGVTTLTSIVSQRNGCALSSERRTNPEKGKPFVERLILGSGFHTDNRDAQWTKVDIAPYTGYKFSDRFRAGLGVAYRVAVDVRNFEVSRTDKTYGYRFFGDYRIFNGLFAHLEVETLKTTIPSWHSNKLKLKDANEALWVPMAYVGIMKSYRVGRRFTGQTQILYDFLAVSRNFDFNKVSFRFGFEYSIEKRKRTDQNAGGG